MAIGSTRKFAALSCYECGATLGWTSPGEARTAHKRAHVYCSGCVRDKTERTLTKRERETLDALAELAATGEPITYQALIARLGVSHSRVTQLLAGIRAHGHGKELDALLGVDTLAEPVAPEAPAAAEPGAPEAAEEGGGVEPLTLAEWVDSGALHGAGDQPVA